MADDTSPSYYDTPAPSFDSAMPEMAVPDYTMFGAEGGMVQPVKKYLGGGLNEDDEEDTPDDRSTLPSPSKLPAMPAGGSSAPAQPTAEKDGLLGMAIHGGLDFLQKTFGLSQANAAEAPAKTAVPTEQKAQGNRLFMSGMGAMSPQEYDEVMKSVDPNGQMDEHLRHIAGIKGVFDYYMKKGDVTSASKAAGAMIQASRLAAAQYAGAAEAELKAGNYSKAADLLKRSYNQVPDGNTVDASVDASGNGVMTITDQSGKAIARQPFTPQAMMSAALGMKNGTLFYNTLVQTAGANLGNQPSGAFKSAVRDLYGINADQGAPGGAPGAAPAPPPPPREAVTPAAAQTETSTEEDTDGFAVPNRLVPASTDQAIPQGRPQAPQVPTMVQPNKQHMASMSEEERDTYLTEVKKENARRQAEYSTAMTGHRAAVKEHDDALKGAASKPLDPGFSGKIGDEIKETMPTYIKGFADPTKVAAGATGDAVGFGDEKKAGEFIGKANQLKIATIAKDIAMRNASARDGNAAVAAAADLVQPDTDNPKKANFRALGRTPDGSVVLQASDGRRMVVGPDTYAQIRSVSGDLYGRYKKGIEDAKKPTQTQKALDTIKEGVKGAYNEAIKPATPEQLKALPQVPTPSLVPQKPSMGQAIPVPGGLPNGKPLFALPNPDYSPQ